VNAVTGKQLDCHDHSSTASRRIARRKVDAQNQPTNQQRRWDVSRCGFDKHAP
jgi:hypothetical protein